MKSENECECCKASKETKTISEEVKMIIDKNNKSLEIKGNFAGFVESGDINISVKRVDRMYARVIIEGIKCEVI